MKKHKNRKRAFTSVFVPKDFQWKSLSKMVEGFREFLTDQEYKKITIIVRKRDKDGLYDLAEVWSPRCMASDGISIANFFAKYQLSSYLKKFPFKGDASTRKKAALKTFYEAEKTCSTFNKGGFRALLRCNAIDPNLCGTLDTMREFIIDVIGERPDLGVILKNARHGPGASLCTDKGRVTKFYKFRDYPYSVTEAALPYATDLLNSDQRWLGALQDKYRRDKGIPIYSPIDVKDFYKEIFKVVDHNRITTVPKDGRKDRTIAIEPRLNVMLQLGVDGFIRHRLKRFACNLDSQVRNQYLAELGSVMEGEGYATLDLSAASDTISMMLFYLLFPPEWIDLLTDLRSRYGSVSGSEDLVTYEKLSSMGNGFTFAIESLIFLAASYAVMVKHNLAHWHKPEQAFDLHEDISVFGDDIIVPDLLAGDVKTLLTLMGFKMNTEKSFWGSNPFRESCGKDFYRGRLVRPLFLTEGISDVKQAFAHINRFKILSSNNPCGPYWTEGITQQSESWLSKDQLNFVGPPSLTEVDTYLHMTHDDASTKRLLSYQNGLYRFNRCLTVAKVFKTKEWFFGRLLADHRPAVTDPVLDEFCPKNWVARFWHLPMEQEKLPWDSTHGDQTESVVVYNITQRNKLRYVVQRKLEASTSLWKNSYSDCIAT